MTGKNFTLDEIPGSAFEVWGGWVWITDSEHRWTKSRTREECEELVLFGCRRFGIDHALAPDLETVNH